MCEYLVDNRKPGKEGFIRRDRYCENVPKWKVVFGWGVKKLCTRHKNQMERFGKGVVRIEIL